MTVSRVHVNVFFKLQNKVRLFLTENKSYLAE